MLALQLTAQAQARTQAGHSGCGWPWEDAAQRLAGSEHSVGGGRGGAVALFFCDLLRAEMAKARPEGEK